MLTREGPLATRENVFVTSVGRAPEPPTASEDLDSLLAALDGVDLLALLGARPERVLFASGNLSRVFGVRTEAGRELVVKIRPDSSRFDATAAVQAVLADTGMPVPAPVRGPLRAQGRAISVEAFVPGGHTRGPAPGAARDFARGLHRLIEAAPPAADHAALHQDVPGWVAWDHDGAELWPARDDAGAPIHGPGPDDVDAAGAAAREMLRALDRPAVIGHGDFEDQNLRWDGTRIHVVHDWDSLVAQPECAIVGATAAIWPAGVVAWCATIPEAEEFVAAYEAERGRPFDAAERRAAWAAALWQRAFNARKHAADGGGMQLDLFRRDAAALAERAGI
jgi:Ser/Thr protein kinase RdoA (MazF antagonist)